MRRIGMNNCEVKLGIICTLCLLVGSQAFTSTSLPLRHPPWSLQTRNVRFHTLSSSLHLETAHRIPLLLNQSGSIVQESSDGEDDGAAIRAARFGLLQSFSINDEDGSKATPAATIPQDSLQYGVSATMLTLNTSSSSSNKKKASKVIRFASSWKSWSVALLILQLARSFHTSAPALTTAVSTFTTWYMARLTSNPLYTKCITAAIIGLLGDGFAQWFEQKLLNRKAPHSREIQKARNYDARRGFSNVADNLFISGPLLHFAYNGLEHLLPVASATTGMAATMAAMTQVLIDDLIFGAIFVVIMFVTTGLAEGYSPREITSQLKKDLAPTVRAGWTTSLFCMPLEYTIIRYFPLSFRVLGMNFIGIFWGAMISYMSHRSRHKMRVHAEV